MISFYSVLPSIYNYSLFEIFMLSLFYEKLLQILNDEDEGKKMFIDPEELGKPIGNREKLLPLAKSTTCFTRRKAE